MKLPVHPILLNEFSLNREVTATKKSSPTVCYVEESFLERNVAAFYICSAYFTLGRFASPARDYKLATALLGVLRITNVYNLNMYTCSRVLAYDTILHTPEHVCMITNIHT